MPKNAQREFIEFDSGMLDKAAGLLAERHRRDRERLPGLPARFERIEEARRAVEGAWRRANTCGVAAVSGSRLLGFVLAEREIDPLRGRHAWVHPAGQALAPDCTAELYRDVYAAAAPAWLEWGCFDHYVTVSAADPSVLDAWLRLGFAYEQVHALCSLGDLEDREEPAQRADLAIRRAGPEDARLLADLAPLIRRHQAGAPVWAPALPEDEAEIRAGYAGLAGDAEWTVWLAFVESQPVAMQAYRADPSGDEDLLTPESCISLTVAATVPAARGLGAGLALTRHGLRAARAAGYAWCSADWRITNLVASRFWPQRGFNPVAYRLVRKVDERVVWAR